MMACHYMNSSISDIKRTIPIIGNRSLLLAVRAKSLGLNDRKKILYSIEKKCVDDKIDTTNLDIVSSFIQEVLKELETNNY